MALTATATEAVRKVLKHSPPVPTLQLGTLIINYNFYMEFAGRPQYLEDPKRFGT